MKKYRLLNVTEQRQRKSQQLDALLLFQYQLRNHEDLDRKFHWKALEIAEGLQPWIDALKISLKR